MARTNQAASVPPATHGACSARDQPCTIEPITEARGRRSASGVGDKVVKSYTWTLTRERHWYNARVSFEKLAENAACVPDRVTILNEIARLQSVLQSACHPQARSEVAAALRDQ